jgi:lipopolysaccharide biosynthesis protein
MSKPKYHINTNGELPTIISDSFTAAPFDVKYPKNTNNLILAVTIHIFYTDLTEYIIVKLYNIPGIVKLKVFITTDTEAKKAEIESHFSKTGFNYQIKVFENIGRDIAPSLIGFKQEILKSDLFLHLHTKKSLYNQDLNNWRDDIFNKLLGSKQIAGFNLKLLLSNGIGLILPSPPDFIKEHMNWGLSSDYAHAKVLLKRSGYNLSKLSPLYFPAGSMFFAKTEVIKPIIKTLNIEDFNQESGQVSGTMAHAVERSFCFFAELAKLKWIVIKIQDGRPVYYEPQYKLLSRKLIFWYKFRLKGLLK